MSTNNYQPIVAAGAPTLAVDLEVMSSRKMKAQMRAQEAKTKLSSPWASALAIIIAIAWTIPTIGLVVNTVRAPNGPSTSGWWTFFSNVPFTTENYVNAWTGNGTGQPLSNFILNTFVITIPAVIIPITLALLAAYAFAWIDFKFKNILFVAVFAMQVVPIQVALIPLNRIYVSWGLRHLVLADLVVAHDLRTPAGDLHPAQLHA